MPVIQWVKHLADDVEELIITGFFRDPWPVSVVLFLPVDIPQRKKWIPFMEDLPQRFEILFRVTNDHGTAIYNSPLFLLSPRKDR